jgi:hypothetical protein
VQQCNACNTIVSLDATAPLPHLTGFAQWLGKHAGLLSELIIKPARQIAGQHVHGVPIAAHLGGAQQLLQLSIGNAAQQPPTALSITAATPAAAAARPSAGGPAASAGLAGVGDQQPLLLLQQQGRPRLQQQQQRLCLRSFSSGLATAINLLALLPPQGLTHLDLELEAAITDSSAMSAALVQLSNLQQLRIGSMRDASLGSALTALAQLSRLSSLELCEPWPRLGQSEWLPAPLLRSECLLPPEVAAPLQHLLAQPLPL